MEFGFFYQDNNKTIWTPTIKSSEIEVQSNAIIRKIFG